MGDGMKTNKTSTLDQRLLQMLQRPHEADEESVKKLLGDLKCAFLYGEIKLLTGNSHPSLTEKIADYLDLNLTVTNLSNFADGEIGAIVKENVRGDDVFLIQSLHNHTGYRVMIETELLADCVRDSARRITGVFPWIGFSKQDRRTQPREARSFKVIAKRLSICGLSRVLLFDLHNSTTADFFDIPSDHVYLMRLLIEEFKRRDLNNVIIGSPDIGSAKRAEAVSRLVGITTAPCIVSKYHDPDTKKIVKEKCHVYGDVQGKTVWFFDDMIQSFGSLAIAVELVMEAGAKEVIAAAVHPDFTLATETDPSAFERINSSPIKEVIVVDTIPHDHKLGWSDKITVLDPTKFIGECIKRLHHDEPLSPLFLKY